MCDAGEHLLTTQESEEMLKCMGKCACASPAGSGNGVGGYPWEQKVLDDTVMKGGQVQHSAIISFSDASLRASAPKGFNPDKKVLHNIVSALKGDVTLLAESGMYLKSGTRMSTPGKIDEGKAIYGSDGKGGGQTVFKTKQCVLIVVYESNPAGATRLASEVAEYMEEEGH